MIMYFFSVAKMFLLYLKSQTVCVVVVAVVVELWLSQRRLCFLIYANFTQYAKHNHFVIRTKEERTHHKLRIELEVEVGVELEPESELESESRALFSNTPQPAVAWAIKQPTK